MLSIIIGAIMVIIVSAFCEMRVAVMKLENQGLREHIDKQDKKTTELREYTKELTEDSLELIDDHLILMEILHEKFGIDEVERLFLEKREEAKTLEEGEE